MSLWLLILGFTILYGSLLLKNYRILAIFNRREIKLMIIKDWVLFLVINCLRRTQIHIIEFAIVTLLQYLLGLVAIDIALLIPYTVHSECGVPEDGVV